jgi:hypothetical protein
MNVQRPFSLFALTLGLLTIVELFALMGVTGGEQLVVPTQISKTHYVTPGGDCGGSTPCYGAIQAAVDAASNGDIVKVSQGQ